MSDDEMKNRISSLCGLYRNGLDNIAEWNQLVPHMQQTYEQLSWMENSINKAPPNITFNDEYLLDYLDKSEQEASILGTIPTPPSNFGIIVITSGSSATTSYGQYVRDQAAAYSNKPQVRDWVNETLLEGEKLQSVQNRSNIVRQRLRQLKPFLADLHKQASAAALSAKARTQSPIGAAQTLNRLLDQFKGNLIALCRRGKGTTYHRISDNLAANSALTKTVVADGQFTYDRLNDELVGIRKHKVSTTGQRIVEILREFEEHVVVITDALDPNSTGINFVN